MTEIENDKVEAGTIVQEIQAGYMLGERLLRPSLVAVAKKSVKKKEKMRKKMKKKSNYHLVEAQITPIYQAL